MFAQQTNLPSQNVIKAYIRLKDKKSFPVMLKVPVVLSQLRALIVKKTKISEQDLIVVSQGKEIDFKKQALQHNQLSLKDRSILHVINKKNVRNDIIDIVVRFILRNNEKSCLGETKLVAKTESPIHQFISQKILPVALEMTGHKILSDSVNLISNGIALKKTLNFQNYFIQNEAQIICMINSNEQLENSVRKHHEITVSRKERPSPIKTPERFQSKASEPKQQGSKKLDIDKKQSLPLSENKSEEFVKLESFPSKKYEDEQDFEHSNSKLKKKEKITSDLARKFQKQHEHDIEAKSVQNNAQPIEEIVSLEQAPSSQTPQQRSQIPEKQIKLGDFIFVRSPQKKSQNLKIHELALKFSNFLNRDILDDWFDEPDSPIEVEYPPVERKVPTYLWSEHASQNIEEKNQKYEFSENLPVNLNNAAQLQGDHHEQGESKEKRKVSKMQQRPEGTISLGDFLMLGSLKKKEQQSIQDSFKELIHKFQALIHERYYDQNYESAIEVEYPKVEKKIDPKAGDFIFCGQMMPKSNNIISSELLDRFEKVLEQKNRKTKEQYGQQIEKVQNSEMTETPVLRNNQDEEHGFITPAKVQTEKNFEYLQNAPQKEKEDSQIQEERLVKLGDFIAIKKIDFTAVKSKLLDSILTKYSHLTTV